MKYLLFILAILFLAGCTGVGQCINDNYCSVDEDLAGNCNDCKPEFVVDEDSFQVIAYNDETRLEASVCVDNVGGDYTDNVQIGWAVSSQKEYIDSYDTKWVFFNKREVETDANIDVRDNRLFFDGFLEFNTESRDCFLHEFDILPETSGYYVHFSINGNDAVTERSGLEGNYADKFVDSEIVESYPEYLIEEDLGNFGYIRSHIDEGEDAGYEFTSYSAIYGFTNNFFEAIVADFDSVDKLDAWKLDSRSEWKEVEEEFSYENGIYKADRMMLWISGQHIIIIEGDNPQDIIQVYLAKYPVDIQIEEGVRQFISLNRPQKTTVEGFDFQISIEGASESDNRIKISVNGVSKSFVQGETSDNNGLNIYVKKVYVTDIPVLNASAEIFAKLSEVIYECTGNVPINSQLCEGDDVLTSNATTVRKVVSECTDIKCEYKCNTGYVNEGLSCVPVGSQSTSSTKVILNEDIGNYEVSGIRQSTISAQESLTGVAHDFEQASYNYYEAKLVTTVFVDLFDTQGDAQDFFGTFFEYNSVDVTIGGEQIKQSSGTKRYGWVSGTNFISVQYADATNPVILKYLEEYPPSNSQQSTQFVGLPYGGNYWQVPGTIEAEDYDLEGYYDTTPGNAGSTYRTDDVDIAPFNEGINVGWIQQGEWVEYTITTQNEGMYDISFHMASEPPGTSSFHIERDGIDLSGPITYESTGDWSAYTLVTASGIPLRSGAQTLRIVFDSAEQGFDKMIIS